MFRVRGCSRFVTRALTGLSLAALTATVLTVPGTAVPATAQNPVPQQPNLLMITVDDMALKDLPHLPHVQELLVERGTTLTNGLAPTPLCAPARASLLSGQYSSNHGVHDVRGRRHDFDDRDTLPVWLQDAGYRTGFVGKYLNGYGRRGTWRKVPPGWNMWRASIDGTTYNYSRTRLSIDGKRQRQTRQYNTVGFAEQADAFMARNAPPGTAVGTATTKPWYLWVNYVAPHFGGPRDTFDPRRDRRRYKTPSPQKRYRNAYRHLPPMSTPDMFEKDVSDKESRRVRSRWTPQQRRKLTEMRRQRLAALRSVDDAVARHVALLRRTGQLDHTVIVFSSDNGYQLGEHNQMGKLVHYRNSTGIPMVFRGPGIEAGARRSTIVTNADVPLTLAALAGATPRRRVVDGSDMTSALHGTGPARAIPLQAHSPRGSRLLYRGVRVGQRFNYARITNGGRELFDWAVDPYELHNVARDPRYRDIARRLGTLTRTLSTCRGNDPEDPLSCESDEIHAEAEALAALPVPS